MIYRTLDDQVLVADGPMQAADMADAAARGVTLAVNNRPDGEALDQVDGETLCAAANAAGLDYLHLPISAEFSDEMVTALSTAMVETPGRVLVFCKSGTRAAYLWALARAREGVPPDLLVQHAARAGYNVRPLMSRLQRESDGPAGDPPPGP